MSGTGQACSGSGLQVQRQWTWGNVGCQSRAWALAGSWSGVAGGVSQNIILQSGRCPTGISLLSLAPSLSAAPKLRRGCSLRTEPEDLCLPSTGHSIAWSLRFSAPGGTAFGCRGSEEQLSDEAVQSANDLFGAGGFDEDLDVDALQQNPRPGREARSRQAQACIDQLSALCCLGLRTIEHVQQPNSPCPVLHTRQLRGQTSPTGLGALCVLSCSMCQAAACAAPVWPAGVSTLTWIRAVSSHLQGWAAVISIPTPATTTCMAMRSCGTTSSSCWLPHYRCGMRYQQSGACFSLQRAFPQETKLASPGCCHVTPHDSPPMGSCSCCSRAGRCCMPAEH